MTKTEKKRSVEIFMAGVFEVKQYWLYGGYDHAQDGFLFLRV